MQTLTDIEFSRFQQFLNTRTGITLADSKQSLVAGRLEKRLRELSLRSFSEYLRRILDPAHVGEAQMAIDLLTTNETYFFREPKHFDRLRARARDAAGQTREFRVWSAACSTGEEAYSAAMVLADSLATSNTPWSIFGTDISTRVLERARRGHYSVARTEHVPPDYLKRYCLRGVGKQAGTLLIEKELRARTQFQHMNLNHRIPQMAKFDVIFLRNVMIYFSNETKREVVERLLPLLREDGLLFVGHSESLNGITNKVRAVHPATFTHA
jgi:chemotaxis protein methyltransferase CheR